MNSKYSDFNYFKYNLLSEESKFRISQHEFWSFSFYEDEICTLIDKVITHYV